MSDQTDDQTGATGAADDQTGDETDDVAPDETGKFDADYVGKLRAENATHRRKARELSESLDATNEALRHSQGRLVELEVAEACRGIMADPSDLVAHVAPADILDDDGRPDPEKIAAAARALVERKPHLAPRRPVPAGDVDQGARPPGPEPFDFAGLLRKAAG